MTHADVLAPICLSRKLFQLWVHCIARPDYPNRFAIFDNRRMPETVLLHYH